VFGALGSGGYSDPDAEAVRAMGFTAQSLVLATIGVGLTVAMVIDASGHPEQSTHAHDTPPARDHHEPLDPEPVQRHPREGVLT
jgi:hypothetical protein